ncbi:MAG: hypothetical protein JWL77_341 [Chthonomonadaceae bacterium]|nr:hypothetical protein [Chthonomonadaceae bacterium]
MLFNYRYVPHNIEKFQSWLDHLVTQVWCRNSGSYSIDLLHPDLKAVVEEIGNDDSIKTDHLDGPIRTIDALFQKLSPAQRAQISVWYDNNNDVEALCANDPTKPPATYDDIKVIDKDLAIALKDLYTNLFSHVIGLSAVERRLNTSIGEHYKDFVKVNDHDRCPYCGIYRLDGEHDTTRDAYDHFLPKGTYPFNSVNFRNLAPMCGKCNSGYKLKKDPVRHIDPLHKAQPRTRRKAFYSYTTTASGISIDLSFSTSNIDTLCPSDITVTVTAPGREEEVESWKDIFGIEQRYKSLCCAKNDGKYWLVQAINECANVGKTPNAIIQNIEEIFDEFPWAEANFLKLPFLRACQNAGLF